MNLIMIGKFISELRKEQGYTQEQLGEKIGVTNKTVSRWETGTYLPPADILLVLSNLFGVSINEILSGRRLAEEDYKTAAEANLVKAVKESSFSLKEKTDFYKKKWLREHIAIMCFLGICIVGVFAAGIVSGEYWLGYVSMVMLISGHCWRNNAMMAYVEKKIYNGN